MDELPPRKAVLIDDETHIRTLMSSIVRSLGFQVVAQLSSDEQAAETVRKADASLVLLDINMPGKTGVEILKEILAINDTCVIMLTAINDPKVIGKCLDAGATHYIL
ncbi:MAG: response regulator transcription factor, partial [Pseudomonadales bacterium]|nr:response regulator transcription factor [Pseudomonadales bacterium]